MGASIDFTASFLTREDDLDHASSVITHDIANIVSMPHRRMSTVRTIERTIKKSTIVVQTAGGENFTFVIYPPGSFADQPEEHWRITLESNTSTAEALMEDLSAIVRIFQRF